MNRTLLTVCEDAPRRAWGLAATLVALLVWAAPAAGAGEKPSVAGPAGGPLWEPADEKDMPGIWMHLANERAMFPMRMANVAMKIGPRRQLFVDNCLIAEAGNVTRQVHQPKRYKGNPLLKPVPGMLWVQHVLKFDESPKFRMWYTVAPGPAGWHVWKKGESIRFASSYAVSDDGMNWKRPNLDLYKPGKSTQRNIILPYGMMHGLFYEPWEPDPKKRFKALVCMEGFKSRNGKLIKAQVTIPEGYYLHWSADGIHWQGDLSHYVLPSLTGAGIPQSGLGDTSRFWWDSIRRKYIADGKLVLRGRRHTQRSRGMMESDDLIHWTRPHPTFVATARGTQIYGHRGVPYQGMYIGLRWLFRMAYHPKEVHASDLALDCSRDGRLWTRVGAPQLFMQINPKRDTWDSDINSAVSLLEVGDEVWIYYFSSPSRKFLAGKDHLRGHWPGLAKLRLDGFASLNAGAKVGTVVTRPLTFEGDKLHVNAQVAPGGYLKVALRTIAGQPVERRTLGACTPVTGDVLRGRVTWGAAQTIGRKEDKPLRLVFELKNAKLYSFRID